MKSVNNKANPHLLILLCLGFMLASFFFVFQYNKRFYFYNKVGDIILLNPFQTDETDFNLNYEKAKKSLYGNDTANALVYYKLMLLFRGSYNEKQNEKRFSDIDFLCKYRIKKCLRYSEAYEMLGKIDSSLSCLRFPLQVNEKRHYGVDETFYKLMAKKVGNNAIDALLRKGIEHTKDANKSHPYCPFVYTIKGFKIGVTKEKYAILKEDKALFLNNLYGISRLSN